MDAAMLAVVVPIVTASISFGAAIVAVVIGQNLGQRGQRKADQARWDREDDLRRRTRSEEMARRAIEELTKVTDLVGWSAGYARGAATTGKRQYVDAPMEEIGALCRPVKRAVLEIDDAKVREHLEKACDLLPNADAAQRFGCPHPAGIAWAVQTSSEAIVSAYLRNVPLPDPLPDFQVAAFRRFAKGYSAVGELWAMYEHEDEDEE